MTTEVKYNCLESIHMQMAPKINCSEFICLHLTLTLSHEWNRQLAVSLQTQSVKGFSKWNWDISVASSEGCFMEMNIQIWTEESRLCWMKMSYLVCDYTDEYFKICCTINTGELEIFFNDNTTQSPMHIALVLFTFDLVYLPLLLGLLLVFFSQTNLNSVFPEWSFALFY